MPPLKTCTTCGRTIAGGTRCSRHARPKRQDRGYDAEYERALKRPQFLAATHCLTCDEPFTPDNPRTGGHVRALRRGGTTADGIFPQCAHCNYGDTRD